MHRKTAVVTGVLYLVTHVTSVTALALYTPVLDDPGRAADPGSATRLLVGGLLEVVLALAVVGTAVSLWPVARRHGEALALGYVALRTLEAAVIAVGVVSVLALLPVGGAGTTPEGAGALVRLHDWAFLVGPGLVCGADTVVLAALLFRSGLVPRWIPVLGLVGGPLVLVSNTVVAFGGYGQTSMAAGLAAVPVFAWELSLAVTLLTRGFRTAPVALRPAPRQEPVAVG